MGCPFLPLVFMLMPQLIGTMVGFPSVAVTTSIVRVGATLKRGFCVGLIEMPSWLSSHWMPSWSEIFMRPHIGMAPCLTMNQHLTPSAHDFVESCPDTRLSMAGAVRFEAQVMSSGDESTIVCSVFGNFTRYQFENILTKST
jgi:hypothetical protein